MDRGGLSDRLLGAVLADARELENAHVHASRMMSTWGSDNKAGHSPVGIDDSGRICTGPLLVLV